MQQFSNLGSLLTMFLLTMTKLSRFFVVAAAALFMVSAVDAATISIDGDLGDRTGLTGGQLQVIVDIAPENFNFQNGGLSLSVQSSNPGVIAFTDAEVSDPPGLGGGFVDRWALRQVNGLTDDGVADLFAAAANTAGLEPALPGNADGGSASRFIFATINYLVVGFGQTDIQVGISSRPDPLVDNGVDVSADVQFEQGAQISVIPEPATVLLAGVGLMGLVAGRRRRS